MGDAHGPDRCTVKAKGDRKCPCHAEREIIPAEAQVVERIFTLSASGNGNRSIVDVLMTDHVPAPGKKGWSKRLVRTVLNNKLYIGVVEYGKTCADAVGGQAKKRALVKDASKWTTANVPALRIIPDKLWAAAQKRRAASLERFSPFRNTDGKLNGRPEAGLISAHLLNGFAVCGVCGGSLSYTSKNGNTHAYYCTRRRSYGKHSCTNYRGVPEARLDEAVMVALYKVIKDPKKLWSLYLERADRWKQERALTVDVRANLEAEEQRLEAAIGRLLDHLEAGEDVGLRLKQRRAELDALRVRLAEPEPVVESEADFQKTVHDHSKPILGWHPNSRDGERDIAQTRAALRALGIGRIVVTPTEGGGWTFTGDGNLAGMVSGNRGTRGAPKAPRAARPSRAAPRNRGATWGLEGGSQRPGALDRGAGTSGGLRLDSPAAILHRGAHCG
ncbi:MAG: recombinase family protein [Candidatus Rokuibacteriota bacterium]